ncbi:MAG TPA: hypothetical protein VKN76_04030 [Kiloniellaceae bacterium]|nr:hypothetical protein [Kiloniellaceae bacterium]
MNKILYGKSSPYHDLSLEDFLAYPIWEWALDEETLPGRDETWVRPMINVTDVDDRRDGGMILPLILFRVVGSDAYGIGEYQCGFGELQNFVLLKNDEATGPKYVRDIALPAIFEALPTIGGQSGVRFLYEEHKAVIIFRTDLAR